MKFLSPAVSLVLILGLFAVPTLVSAQVFPSLIVCGDDEDGDGILQSSEQCHFKDLIQLGINLIEYMIIVSTLLATVAFIIIGFKLLTSGGNPSAKSDAKKMAMKVLVGYLWILAAWLLVYTITSTLLKDGYFILESPR